MVPMFMKEGEVMNLEESGGMNMLIEKRGSIGVVQKVRGLFDEAPEIHFR